MYAHLVLYAAYVDATLVLVVDKHGEAAAVVCAFFGTGEHEVNVGVAVGDEALHAVEKPAAVLLAVGGLEHDALEVTACIGLGEVHRHGGTGADAGNEAAVLVVVAELIEGFYAVLQTPDVAEAGITCRH